MTTKYTIEVEVDEQWLNKWYQGPEDTDPEGEDKLQLWADIATAGTGISVYTVYKKEE